MERKRVRNKEKEEIQDNRTAVCNNRENIIRITAPYDRVGVFFGEVFHNTSGSTSMKVQMYGVKYKKTTDTDNSSIIVFILLKVLLIIVHY